MIHTIKFYGIPNLKTLSELEVAFTEGTVISYAGLDWHKGRYQFRKDTRDEYMLVAFAWVSRKDRAMIVHTFIRRVDLPAYLVEIGADRLAEIAAAFSQQKRSA